MHAFKRMDTMHAGQRFPFALRAVRSSEDTGLLLQTLRSCGLLSVSRSGVAQCRKWLVERYIDLCEHSGRWSGELVCFLLADREGFSLAEIG